MKTLTVTLKDIEGMLHGSATARTNARVSAHYTSDLTLTDGSIVPALVKVKPAVVAGEWEFQVYASDDPAVKAECRGFAVVVEAKVRSLRYGGERTVRRTVKPLLATTSPVSLGNLPTAEPVPQPYTSVQEMLDSIADGEVATGPPGPPGADGADGVLQTITLAGTTLTLSGGGGSVTLPSGGGGATISTDDFTGVI